MTDRDICRKCIHSYFTSYTHFEYCNYLDDTGNRRPHDGDVCYGYEETNGKKKRRRSTPPPKPKRNKRAVKAPEDVQIQQDTQIQQAALIQQAVSVIRRERDKDVRAAAQRIRNKMFDEMTMWTQHMGDNVNRIV
jgi:hypothetical protein